MLYDSLHGKLLALPDATEGLSPRTAPDRSAGATSRSETTSTIGEQRRFNYALRPMSREEFVRLVTTDLPEAPAYFSRDVAMNREGAPEMSRASGAGGVSRRRRSRDCSRAARSCWTRAPRPPSARRTCPGALHIGLSGQFASWAGALVSPQAPIVHRRGGPGARGRGAGAARPRRDRERRRIPRRRRSPPGRPPVGRSRRSSRSPWTSSSGACRSARSSVVDVRRPPEWQSGHIADAAHVPLNELPQRAGELDRDGPLALVCAGGYRSSIATSLLERRGFRRIANVVGGMAAWTTRPGAAA